MSIVQAINDEGITEDITIQEMKEFLSSHPEGDSMEELNQCTDDEITDWYLDITVGGV